MDEAREFHEHYGLTRATYLTKHDAATAHARIRRIMEEAEEVREELLQLGRTNNFIDAYPILLRLAKELADLRYSVEGTAVVFGIDLEAVYAEVHRSNMTKEAPADGDPNGKVRKGEGYSPANVERALGYPLIDE